MEYSTSLLIIVFIIYALIIFIISYFANKSTHNLSDYVLGSRSLSGKITAIGAGASDMSSWLLMALPGVIYLRGLKSSLIAIAISLGAYFNWLLVSKRLRVFTEVANNSLTIPTFFCNRFQEFKYLRIVTGLSILVFFTFYLVAGFTSGALLLVSVFKISYPIALFISAIVIVGYTAIGGFLAVSWVDFFQGGLILVSLAVLPIITINFLGGYANTYDELVLNVPGHLKVFADLRFLSVVSLLSWGLGYFGQPHIITRFMAVKTVSQLVVARRICMLWMVMVLIGAVVTGLVGAVFFAKHPLTHPDTVFIELSKNLFNPWLAGIMLSAILSAIMSTVSAQILISASIVVEDFYHGIFRKNASDQEYLWAGRIFLIIMSAAAIALALNPSRTILQSVGFAWSGLGASFGPTVLFALYWRKMTKYAAIVGIIVGTLVVIFWGVLANIFVSTFFNNPNILPGFEMLPGFFLSSASIIIVSLLWPEQNLIVDEYFDAMLAKI